MGPQPAPYKYITVSPMGSQPDPHKYSTAP
jgi:hypothetical protein